MKILEQYSGEGENDFSVLEQAASEVQRIEQSEHNTSEIFHQPAKKQKSPQQIKKEKDAEMKQYMEEMKRKEEELERRQKKTLEEQQEN